MTGSRNSRRFAILLPAGCQPDEAATLEQTCRAAVAEYAGQVLQVYTEDDLAPLVTAIQDQIVYAILYPPHESLVHEPLITGIVHGVFGGVYGVILHCIGHANGHAVPRALVQVTLAIMEQFLRSWQNQSPGVISDNLPFGYRYEGDTVVIDPAQAEPVRKIFRDAVDNNG